MFKRLLYCIWILYIFTLVIMAVIFSCTFYALFGCIRYILIGKTINNLFYLVDKVEELYDRGRKRFKGL